MVIKETFFFQKDKQIINVIYLNLSISLTCVESLVKF